MNTGAEVQTQTGRVRKSSWASPKGMQRKCEHQRGNINADGAGVEVIQRKADCLVGAAEGFVGKYERRRGSVNADGAGAEVFAGDEHSRERLFDPMAAISRQ